MFTNLLSLHKSPVPEENFFTEMIAGLLDKDRSLLSSWLKEFLNINNNYSHIRVETQVGLGKLDKYTSGSRPDILITLSDNERDNYVLIESKIGSKEGHFQLSKYADHLIEKYPEESIKYLVFISKNYEHKDLEKVITTANQNVFFKQFLWHDFYNFLNRQLTNPPSLLHNEVLDFMRRKNMTEISRITPATLSAIGLFPDVFAFFQTVLVGEVTEQFTKLFGQKPKSNISQLAWREYSLRYNTNNWSYSIGFWMPETDDGFPYVFACFYIPRDSMELKKLITIFEQLVSETANSQICWKKFDWDDPNSNPGIELMCSLGDFIHEENHVSAVKHQLLIFLNETKRVFEKYPIFMKSGS